MRGKRSRHPQATKAKIGWRHPPASRFTLQGQNGGNGHKWLPLRRGREPCPRRGSLLQGLGNCMTQGRTRIKGCGSLVAPPFPPFSRPSASVCTRTAQVNPAPTSREALQPGSLMDRRRDKLGKRETYLFGRGRTASHTQCNRLQRAGGFAGSELSWHSPTAVSPGCSAERRAPVPHSPGTAAGEGARVGWDTRAVLHQPCSCLPEDAAGVTMATRDAPIPRPRWEPPPLATC